MWHKTGIALGVILAAAVAQMSSAETDWQTAAEGKMEFDVASVKPSRLPKPPNFPLNRGSAVVPGGRLSVSLSLSTYIAFAYKLSPGDEQRWGLPKWADTDFFEIDARAKGNPTKDQMRLMMQSLLADRFKLAVHFENREAPVLALTLEKPAMPGPKLRPHAEGPPCPDAPLESASRPALPATGAVFPAECDTLSNWFKPDGSAMLGSRNTTMALLADAIYSYGQMSGEIDKPVVDGTGLNGKFDYVIEWTGRAPGPPAPGVAAAPPGDPQGATFLEAVRDQLGLRLVQARAPIRTIVVDRVERPSEN